MNHADRDWADELLLAQAVALRLTGAGLIALGGIILVTDHRIVSASPLDYEKYRRQGKAWEELHDAPISPQRIIASIGKHIDALWEIPVDAITMVKPCRKSGFRLEWHGPRQLETQEFRVHARRGTPIWSKKNVPERDRVVTAIGDARNMAAIRRRDSSS